MAKRRTQWPVVLGSGAILLFCILMLFRLGIPERLFSGEDSREAPVRSYVPTGEAWMNILQQGRKIGYAQRSMTPTEKGYHFSESLFIRINTLGVVQPLTMKTTAELKHDRTLAGFQFDLASNLFKFTAGGTVEGNHLTVSIGNPGEKKISVITLSAPPYLGGGILESAGTVGLRPGEGKTFHVFDPASLGQRPVRVTFLGEETLKVMGEIRLARKLSVDFMGIKQIAWVNQDGSVLREEGMLGISLVRVTREEALMGLEGGLSADLTEIASIRPSRTIEDTDSLRLLRLHPDGFPEEMFTLDGGRQTFRNGVLTIRRESADPSLRVKTDPEDLSAFLKATPYIQADHPKIRQQAARIVRPTDPDGVKADKLLAWVYKNLEKRPVLSVPNALETMENQMGDCNEHAVLLAALARSTGVPAEVEAGVVYLRGRFFYHAWNVLYLKDRGGWTTADAVFGQMPADVTHIRFVRGEADRQLDLAGLIGRLTLEILEMER
jgi:hypothetical protein